MIPTYPENSTSKTRCLTPGNTPGKDTRRPTWQLEGKLNELNKSESFDRKKHKGLQKELQIWRKQRETLEMQVRTDVGEYVEFGLLFNSCNDGMRFK
jgi:hypothetical protein